MISRWINFRPLMWIILSPLLTLYYYPNSVEKPSSQKLSQERSSCELHNLKAEEARRLGQSHAQEKFNLLARLDCLTLRSDEKALRKHVLRLICSNHPDKNKAGDQELLKYATQLLSFLDKECYGIYLEALEGKRTRSSR